MHEAFPEAAIFVRAFDRRSMIEAEGRADRGRVREVRDSAIKLARMRWTGSTIDGDDIRRTEALYRADDRERLDLQRKTGDLRAADRPDDHAARPGRATK